MGIGCHSSSLALTIKRARELESSKAYPGKQPRWGCCLMLHISHAVVYIYLGISQDVMSTYY